MFVVEQQTENLHRDFSKSILETEFKVIPSTQKPTPGTTTPPTTTSLSVLCWNLLAPPWNQPEEEHEWLERVKRQIKIVEEISPDVVALQEFWVANSKYMQLWQDLANSHGYTIVVTKRTRHKEDGCCMLLREALQWESLNVESFSFNDYGNKIFQVLTLRIAGKTIVMANTHLTHPHPNNQDRIMRFYQGQNLGMALKSHPNVVLMGDFNGDVNDFAVVELIKASGLKCTMASSGWVSHLSHSGHHMACDLVLTKGDVSSRGYEFEATETHLLQGKLTSDHRHLTFTIDLSPS
eukprot:m.180312 g.180312  ORF g.180312 m.180312 type:complete len:294 (-) comp32016_c1_seq1:288-1169(-)